MYILLYTVLLYFNLQATVWACSCLSSLQFTEWILKCDGFMAVRTNNRPVRFFSTLSPACQYFASTKVLCAWIMQFLWTCFQHPSRWKTSFVESTEVHTVAQVSISFLPLSTFVSTPSLSLGTWFNHPSKWKTGFIDCAWRYSRSTQHYLSFRFSLSCVSTLLTTRLLQEARGRAEGLAPRSPLGMCLEHWKYDIVWQLRL